MTTLRRERIQKFIVLVTDFIQCSPAITDVIGDDDVLDQEIVKFANKLVEAAESNTERKTDETAAEYNAELFKGDWREYAEH